MRINRRLILSLAIIAFVSAGAYAASQALFVDTESNTSGATFTVGTMDLDVDSNSAGFDQFSVANIGADGVVSGTKTWTVTNTGTVPGTLTFSMSNLVNAENGCEEPERQTDIAGYTADTTCDNPGNGQGELGSVMDVDVTLRRTIGDPSSDVAIVTNGDLTDASVYATSWNTNAGTVTLDASDAVEVTIAWETTPADYDNSIQGDSLTFDIGFRLDQVTPTN